jgi:hypothetical protein
MLSETRKSAGVQLGYHQLTGESNTLKCYSSMLKL